MFILPCPVSGIASDRVLRPITQVQLVQVRDYLREVTRHLIKQGRRYWESLRLSLRLQGVRNDSVAFRDRRCAVMQNAVPHAIDDAELLEYVV